MRYAKIYGAPRHEGNENEMLAALSDEFDSINAEGERRRSEKKSREKTAEEKFLNADGSLNATAIWQHYNSQKARGIK